MREDFLSKHLLLQVSPSDSAYMKNKTKQQKQTNKQNWIIHLLIKPSVSLPDKQTTINTIPFAELHVPHIRGKTF